MKDTIHIRTVVLEDTCKLLAIYAPYVTSTAVTFEYEVPSVDEFSKRIQNVQKKYPFLAAEIGGEIVGYAYADAFHVRSAYDWAVETSIYVKPGKKRSGIGSRLHEALEVSLKSQGILNMNACIAFLEKEDEYLTKDSVVFHEKSGYHHVGQFHSCGYKFGRWYHMIWMEKHIGEHTNNPPQVKSFSEISECFKGSTHP